MPDQPDILRHTPPRRLKLVGVIVLCVAAVIVVLGLLSRVRADQTLKTWTNAQAVPIVKVISLNGGSAAGSLVLPGNIQAFNSAPIHARVPGYLKAWYADIGAEVKAGQILADIDTPDLDQQLAQAKADLATAVANQHLADTTAKRWTGLLAQDAVSHQDSDEKNGDLAAKTTLVASAKANVDRLLALEAFKRIVAPFDGIVTTRSTDIGALISVGGPTDTPLFTVADERRLRVYVQVPQAYTADVRPGMTVSFTVPEHPGQTFTGQLSNSADAITPQTGTQLIQLQIDNAGKALRPGDYAQVKFDLPANDGAIIAPSSALMFRDSGMSVAVIGPDGRVAIKPVTISRDLGATVVIGSGLTASDRVIDNPPDSLRAGDPVKIAAAGAGRSGAGPNAVR
jgi:RND family efflux transporter MFP subunit